MNYTPFHEVRDQEKLAELIASMGVNGWQGAALVADGEQLITGTHRYAAAQALELEVPVVDIRDIYPEWEALHAEFGSPTADERDYTDALAELPEALRSEYGIDAH